MNVRLRSRNQLLLSGLVVVWGACQHANQTQNESPQPTKPSAASPSGDPNLQLRGQEQPRYENAPASPQKDRESTPKLAKRKSSVNLGPQDSVAVSGMGKGGGAVAYREGALGALSSGDAAPRTDSYGRGNIAKDERFPAAGYNTEEYNRAQEQGFVTPQSQALSTFSIDVDTASYSNVRRFIFNGQLPPADAVRVEELINYFKYDYTHTSSEPFTVHSEVAACPWNSANKIVQIGIQGRRVDSAKLPPSYLVFLIDVSGSMSDTDKLPLLKRAFAMLVEQLREQDRVSIVVYAGAAGSVLPSTSGQHKAKILQALDQLDAGGSTAGGEGIQLAYAIAHRNFLKEGNNRIILATDGDFNVGVSSDGALQRLIEKERKGGVFLSVLGFGQGNIKDSKMELLADKGNGNYAYIDSIREAEKVFMEQLGGTLLTIAKDVKIQVEFNPAKVKAYRLIGYNNRRLANEDFNDDKKDAGELGAGHSVTALYEIVPVGASSKAASVDTLRYQEGRTKPEAYASQDLMTVKLRYKEPKGTKSQLLSRTIADVTHPIESASSRFRFVAAVAEFGMLLSESEHRAQASFEQCLTLARKAVGTDKEGYRREFLQLVETSARLKSNT